ncbi:MAG TPA: hypothetical protein VE223_03120 [Nitrososphaeraceae archaeon]|nr:hypothetical protein [Nitrososphaeraceae archaeon]
MIFSSYYYSSVTVFLILTPVALAAGRLIGGLGRQMPDRHSNAHSGS